MGGEGQAMVEGNKTTEPWNAMWPEDSPHTRTHTPSRVCEKRFPLFRSSAGGKPRMCSVDILAPIEHYLDKKETELINLLLLQVHLKSFIFLNKLSDLSLQMFLTSLS